MSKYRFFSNISSDEEFIKACHDVAKSVFGDAYDEDKTEKVAQGILKDQEGDYNKKIGIFRNGIKGFSDPIHSVNQESKDDPNSIPDQLKGDQYDGQRVFGKTVTERDLMEFNFYIKGKLKTPILRKKFKSDKEYEDFMIEYQEKALESRSFGLTVDNDPSIINPDAPASRHGMPKLGVPQVTADWSLNKPFNISIEPWLIANVVNDKPDGLYQGTVLGDTITSGNVEIKLDIKLADSTSVDAFILVKSGKAIIYKISQLCKSTSKTFSIGEQSYGFDITPTAPVYDMEHLIGSWMMAASIAHLFHICDRKYAGHMALDEFYKEFPEKIDTLAEHYLADNNNAFFKVCIAPAGCPVDYLTRLLEFTKTFEQMSTKIPSAYQSQIDDIVNQTQSTLYKLKRLDSGRRCFSDTKRYYIAEVHPMMRSKAAYLTKYTEAAAKKKFGKDLKMGKISNSSTAGYKLVGGPYSEDEADKIIDSYKK